MNTSTRMAAMLSLAVALGSPLAAQAQTSGAMSQASPAPMSGHHRHHRDPFMRALHKLSLTADQKSKIKSLVASTKQADENATPEQRKANGENLHQQITALLTPAQQQQLSAELAQERSEHKQHMGQMPAPSAT